LAAYFIAIAEEKWWALGFSGSDGFGGPRDMPVILSPAEWPVWLCEEQADQERLKARLRPYAVDDLAMWPVDPPACNVKNDGPSLIEPVDLTAPSTPSV
jgi:hypothetical protein